MDIAWQKRHVDRLISHDLDIVSGAYSRKNDPEYIHGGYWKKPGRISQYLSAKETGLHEVDWVPGGFLLVKRKVFETMFFPWWECPTIPYKVDGVQCAEVAAADMGFCMNAKK
jgi:hypothetical protein